MTSSIEWSDAKKWVMGMVASLLVASIVDVAGLLLGTVKESDARILVRIVDSASRREAVERLVSELKTLEMSENLELDSNPVPRGGSAARELAEASILVAHLHTFRERGGHWDPEAQRSLFDLVGRVAAPNGDTAFVIYSRTFQNPGARARAIEEAKERGQIPSGLSARIHTLAFPLARTIDAPTLQAWTDKLRELARATRR